jgi:hypothetical protein
MWVDILLFILAWLLARNFTIKSEEPETPKINQTKILIEKIEDQYYLWKIDDKEEFLTQSKDLNKVVDYIATKFDKYHIDIKTSEEIACLLKDLITTNN